MKTLLLHCCCGPCTTHPIRLLLNSYEVTAFFFNPNIQPESEHAARLEEMRSLSKRWGFELLEETEGDTEWMRRIQGHEQDPEGGERCSLCYSYRLERTALRAAELGFHAFASTLTISPHKRADVINPIGLEAGRKAGVEFLEVDFKKKDGFKISCRLSHEEGLYRQDYCGCLYSRRHP